MLSPHEADKLVEDVLPINFQNGRSLFFESKAPVGRRETSVSIRLLLRTCAPAALVVVACFALQISPQSSLGLIQANVTNSENQSVEDINKLIGELGSPDYAARTLAENELVKVGTTAIEPLRTAVAYDSENAPDSEIRMRAKRLLILIERREYEKNVQAFLAGETDQISLYGWPEFSAIAGESRPARRLFVDVHETQPTLIKAIPNGREMTSLKFQDVIRRYIRVSSYTKSNQLIGNLAAVLFIASIEIPGNDGTPGLIQINDYSLSRIKLALTNTNTKNFVKNNGCLAEMQRLIRSFMEQLPTDSAKMYMTKLEIIKAFDLKEELDLAFNGIMDRELHKSSRTFALEVIEALGDESAISKLENAFDDKTLMSKYFSRPNQDAANEQPASKLSPAPLVPMTVQFGDLALLVAVRIRKGSPSEIGFEETAVQEDKTIFNKAGFSSDETRSIAIENWNRFQQDKKETIQK